MADDFAEINRIRVSMGVAPLQAPGYAPEDIGLNFKSRSKDDSDDEGPSTVNTRQAQGGENWAKLEAKREAEQKRVAQKEAIRKERERAALNKRLEGKGLADADEDVDASSWIAGTKKRQKKIEKERARKLAEELAQREREAQEDYTATDLAGVRVGHELGDFDEGNEQVLTLKDTAVDASDEEDELENAVLRDREKLHERLENKKRKRAYDPNDVSADGTSNILGQYDEELGQKKKSKAFTLDASGKSVDAFLAEEAAESGKGVRISLDTLFEKTPISDYAEPVEVKIKKPKKSKKKHTRRKADDDDALLTNDSLDVTSMDVDVPAPKRSTLSSDTFDDDDLQTRLAQQRREALKQRKKTRPEDIAKQIRDEAATTPDVMETTEDAEEDEAGLIIDETSRFVANLEKPATPPPEVKTERSTGSPDELDHNGDVKMEIKEEGEGAIDIKDPQLARAVSAEIGETGLDDEKSISSGMGAAVTLLRQRGLVAGANGEGLNAYQRNRQDFLTRKQRAEEEAERRAKQQRDADRQSGRLDHMSTKEKEERARNANANREVQDARRLAELYSKDYRPNVELVYHDEYGRSLDQKDAFKHLSHQFHGKGSGKGKTEKRLKKIDDEKRRMAQSSLDSSDRKAMNYNAASQVAPDGASGERNIK